MTFEPMFDGAGNRLPLNEVIARRERRSTRPRDSQRQKVYAAERTAFNHTPGILDPRYDVGGIGGAQELVNAVFASAILRER